ncbi:F0F1 ATP synthase subunit epsilon [Candidatus Izemoplasma sp. B36]|uniref:F0F1 ATP synthase subunit epsilon n=1 Tax=Candidatus Izemoplasma sp. B36 TaxID=3242468 RepID=UPI0035584674
MNIVIVTPDGELYNEEVTSVIVSSSNNGDYEILKDHLPIVSTIDTGYIKMVHGKMVYYVVVINGVVENINNKITVVSQDAFVGESKESALKNLNDIRAARTEENKKRNVELAKAERELRKQIKMTGAGQL